MNIISTFLSFIFFLVISLFIEIRQAQASNWIVSQTAELQFLDKITARISTNKVQVGGGTEFGTLELRVYHCAYSPPEEPPENAAFIIIYDNVSIKF